MAPAECNLRPVPFTDVDVRDSFWKQRIDTNRRVTLPIEYEQCRKTGRFGAWKLKWKKGRGEQPHIFWDSDAAKWLEAVAYSLRTHPDKALEAKADRLISDIAKAQQPDGYLNLYFTVVEPEKRWSNLRDCHELYCAGHLMEAAVAYHEATGKRKLLDVLCRYADHIDSVFGRGKGKKRGYPGHEEIELGLVKLYRATGEKRYLDLAAYFIDERGRQPHYFLKEARARGEKRNPFPGEAEYCQSHRPVREQDEAVGHAVRACYLYAGMADAAAETGDAALLAACRRLWRNLTQKRMYITGGIGSTVRNEGFTFDYDLPNESGYAETCAAIALVFWAHRMLHLDPDSAYADVMERALYNGVLSGVSRDGRLFFYANPLASHPSPVGAGTGGHEHIKPTRQEWFGTACCPPNIARLIASFGQYVYSQGDDAAYVHLYVAGQAVLRVGDTPVRIGQKTDYPWDGAVCLNIDPEAETEFALHLRIPGWCRGATLKVNGRATPLKGITKKGYARIRRVWRKGDRVKLLLPMPVERMRAHPKVRQNAGLVALQRGPLVYCLEGVDNGADLAAIELPDGSKLSARYEPRTLGGAVVITGKARRLDEQGWKNELYRLADATRMRSCALKAVPYCLWDNRGLNEMRVWIREGR